MTAMLLAVVIAQRHPLLDAEWQRFQGTWTITSVTLDGGEIKTTAIGQKIRFDGYRLPAKPKDGHVTVDATHSVIHGVIPENHGVLAGWPNEVDFFLAPLRPQPYALVFWFEGIYELKGDRLRVCLKYHGQGVEGEAARRWRMPTDFAAKKGQDHYVITLEREAR